MIPLFSHPAQGASEAGAGNSAWHVRKSTAANDKNCAEFLSRAKAGMLSKLQKMLERNKQTELCLLGAMSPGCRQLQEEHLKSLETYSGYRKENIKSDISFNPVDGDFRSIASDNSGHIPGLVNGARNALGQPIDGLSPSEKNSVWNDFDAFQNKFAGDWWKAQMSEKSLPQFSNWNQCVKSEGGRILLDQKPGKHVLFPRFRDFRKEIPREIHDECFALQLYWSKVPYAPAVINAYRKSPAGTLERRAELNAEFKPWMYLLKEDVSSLDRAGRLAAAARAYNRLNAETKRLLDWAGSLGESDVDQLLAFSGIRNELHGQDFCDHYSKITLGNVVKKIGLGLIPGEDIFENIFFNHPRNDQAFLAGFISYDEWSQEDEKLRRESAFSALTAGPVMAADALALQKLVAKASPLVRRVLGKEAEVKPGGGGSEQYRPIPKENGGVHSDELRAFEKESLSHLQRKGTKLEISDLEPTLEYEISRFDIPDVVRGASGHRYYGNVFRVAELPPPVSRGDATTLAFEHPEMKSYLKRMREAGYDLMIDTSLPYTKTGAFFTPNPKMIVLRPAGTWRDFVHEFQHLEFNETIRPLFKKMVSARLEGQDLHKALPPQTLQSIGADKVSKIQKLIDKGLTPEIAINESLSVDAELKALGWKRFLPSKSAESHKYILRHRITELERLGGDLTPQRRELIEASKREIRNWDWAKKSEPYVKRAAKVTGAAAVGAAAGDGTNEDEYKVILYDDKGHMMGQRQDGTWVVFSPK